MLLSTQQEKLFHKLKWVILAIVMAAMLLLVGSSLVQTQPGQQSTVGSISTSAGIQGLIPNPFTASDFTYDENGYMTCLQGESLLGVDVSAHQGEIRWEEVAQSDVRFAMIRLGHRTVREGVLQVDKRWEENYSGATLAGLKVGVYFYSQSISVEEARQEAQLLLDTLDGRPLDMPVVFDWEVYDEQGRNVHLDKQTLSACAIAFCEMISQAGYQPMIYFNSDLSFYRWDLELMQSRGYEFWLVQLKPFIDRPYRVNMWQYSWSGSVPGIDTNVDVNLYFSYE